MSALVPWNPRPVKILWLDLDTGQGVTDDGRAVTVGAGKRPRLAEVLGAAWRASCSRVMLTGSKPLAGWLLAAVPGWSHGIHHLDHETPVGRYANPEGLPFEVRRAAEWFGAGTYTPAQAAYAWDALTLTLGAHIPGMERLLASPAATGREAWLRSRTFDQDGQPVNPPQVSAEVAELLRATSGQHRIELFNEPEPGAVVACPRPPPDASADAQLIRGYAAKLRGENELWLLDGRLMYVACVRELGIGPAVMLTADQASEHFTTYPYGRARYLVRATVPQWWDTVGILPNKAGDDQRDGWEYPNQPGRTFETWADASEVWLAAIQFRWPVVILAGMTFTPGRPLDTWAARLLRAYDQAGEAFGTDQAKLVRAGLRWMLLHSIGAWHSSGRTETTITTGPMTRPTGDGWEAPTVERDNTIWRRRVPLDGRAAMMSHPEWSAQIWGRARARVLWAPTAVKGTWAGALTLPPHQLVSIYGDALMTTAAPEWAASRFDDGKPGRLRVKGFLPDLAAAGGWPTSGARRDRLMHAAEAFGAPLDQTEGE